MGYLGDMGQMQARFGPFRDSVILTQDSCTVCTERIIGTKIGLDAPDDTPR